MRSPSLRLFAVAVAVTVALLLLVVATDKASSRQLSSLAVSAFQSTVGTVIDLGQAPKPTQVASQADFRQDEISVPAPTMAVADDRSQADPPDVVAPVEASASQPGMISSPSESGTSLSTSSASTPGATGRRDSRATSATSGGAGAGTSHSGGSPAGADRNLAAESVATDAPSTERLGGLMDRVMAELVGDGNPTLVASSGGVKEKIAAKGSNTSREPSARVVSGTTPTSAPASTEVATAASQPFVPVGPVAATSAPQPVETALIPAIDTFPNSEPLLPPSTIDEVGTLDALIDDLDNLLTVPDTGFPVPFVAAVSAATPLETSSMLETETIVNPEPATLLLFGTGLALAAGRARRHWRRPSTPTSR